MPKKKVYKLKKEKINVNEPSSVYNNNRITTTTFEDLEKMDIESVLAKGHKTSAWNICRS